MYSSIDRYIAPLTSALCGLKSMYGGVFLLTDSSGEVISSCGSLDFLASDLKKLSKQAYELQRTTSGYNEYLNKYAIFFPVLEGSDWQDREVVAVIVFLTDEITSEEADIVK